MEKELAEINQALVEKDSKFDEIDDEIKATRQGK